ncbi:MAG: hypothetical protein PHI12_13450 [Dehalococcoidales bacterium]|nr:hypothetical protein [Dehalococcoidales bacterium]
MSKKVIDVFVSGDCSPCQEVSDRLKNGLFASDLEGETAVNIIDVTTEEGFRKIDEEKLDRVPSAKFEGKFCQIHIDPDTDAVMFSCKEENKEKPGEPAPASP